MDWILQNLENVVVPIIIMILYGLGSRAQKKQERGETSEEPLEEVENSVDESRRVQDIQEEIRRKIAERTGRSVPPPPPNPRPDTQPASQPGTQYSEPRLPTQSWPRSTPPPPAPRPPVIPAFDQKSQQREIEAKMRKVRELEAKIKKKPLEAAAWGERRKSAPKGQLRKELFEDLASPIGQKKAILVGEILGSPVGIKGPAGWKANV